MTLSEILARFHLLADDDSTFATDEETAIANEEYQAICADRPWEFLKTTATGTLPTSVPYVSLPSDFASFAENAQQTGNTGNYEDLGPKVVYVINGSSYIPYKIVNWSDRRSYVNQDGVAYADIANSRLVFAKQPTTAYSYEFDYIKVPATLTASDSPIFPARFHEAIAFRMAVRSDVQQRCEKARSNAPENKIFGDNIINSMALWNANLRND